MNYMYATLAVRFLLGIAVLSTTLGSLAGGGFIGSTTCTIYEISTMKKYNYKCRVAEAGDIHSVYTLVSLTNGVDAESTLYLDTTYGNTSRVKTKNLLSFFVPAVKRMGKKCAMLEKIN